MAKTTSPKTPDSDVGFIYRPYITLPNGTVIWARNYGKRAFKIPISADNDNGSKK